MEKQYARGYKSRDFGGAERFSSKPSREPRVSDKDFKEVRACESRRTSH